MLTVELILPPEWGNCTNIVQLPKVLREPIEQAQKYYQFELSGYQSHLDNSHRVVNTISNIRMFYFSSLDELLSEQFTSFMQAQPEEENRKSIALLNFRLNENCTNCAIYFDDLIIFGTDVKFNAKRIISTIERLADQNKSNIYSDIVKTFFRMSFVGRSVSYKQLIESVYKYAKCQAPVLIEGETGTGKEALARAIHYFSDSNNKGFIPINCAAIPDSLFESELFGHEKGAFTHAQNKHSGLIELAENGTLFLDEVDTLSAKAQSGLLRFLQTGEIRAVGGTQIRKIKTRIVSATNAKLTDKVKEGGFRSDLHFRLNVLKLDAPPLRNRVDDLDVIARHLLNRFEQKYNRGQKILHPHCLEWLKKQDWPGNVRELENWLLRHYFLTESSIIKLDSEITVKCGTSLIDFPNNSSFQTAKEHAVEKFAESYITSVLAKTSGNVTNAAKLAGKERRAFGKLMKKYSIDAKAFCDE